ncbi:7924_t:CDS:2 [Diversispora eburnea]|uniref:tRNA (guanine(9)-N1)-methyltransferase n=1 Tax=Diversispora eburnea TaxID=1213867 RepID=A0A9N9GD30_9GLOM|nr:7924_t:CDS:2 [Diversispora eburnea]
MRRTNLKELFYSAKNSIRLIIMEKSINDSETINTLDNNNDKNKNVGFKPNSHLSKNALRKLRKQQKWEETREIRKVAQKEKDKRKKLEKKEAIELGLIPPPVKKKKIEQIPSKMKVVIDLSFDNYMTDVEITSVTSQLTRCYSANRSSTNPVTLFFTSYGGRVRERFNDKLKDHVNWKQVVFDTRSYLECLNKEDLIYLTADSTNTLDVLDENKVYIIGGIVDKNRHKEICYEKATKENIATARLPIGNYIELATRKTFLEVIPQRKFNSEGKKKRRKGNNSITINENTTENVNIEDIKDIDDDDYNATLPSIHDESKQ